jgi:spermidine synthase
LEKTPFRLVVEDAAEFLERDECVGAFDLVLLDAYDGAGRVPAHLRDANLGFVGKLVRSLRSPGGFVVANLWNSEDRVEFSRERRELEEFRAQLSTAGASSRVDVKVRGQEGNVVVLASTDTMGGNEALLTSLRGVLEAHPGIATSLVPPEHFAASEPY